MKFVIPLEKMRNETIKMIAEDLGYRVYSEEAEKILKETSNLTEIKEVEEKTIAELQACMLDDDYILTDDIYHIYDEDFYDFLANQEVTDILDKIWELHEAVDKIPVDKRKKQDIFDDLMLTEVYDKLCKKMIKFFEDRC